MEKPGEISVFLAMILLSICTFLCGLAESARTAGARCYLRIASDSAMDSLMAQYHRQLWKDYRILGLEHRDGHQLETEFTGFLQPYLKASNWYPMEVLNTEIRDRTLLTQGNGRYMEQAILDYMEYGLIGTVWDSMDEGGANELLASLKEAGGVNQISGLYEGHGREAVKLEKALEAVSASLERQKELWQEAGEQLEELDGRGFVRKAEKLIRSLEDVPGLVSAYERQADRLSRSLEESRVKFMSQEELSDGVRAGLEEEISQYESYAARDGERRQEVTGLREKSGGNAAFVRASIEEAEAVMEYIDNWEPDDEEDELDEEELWSPVARQWRSYPHLTLGIPHGVADREKEGFLEQVRSMAGRGLLELVLPEGVTVSGRTWKLEEAPSSDASASSDLSESSVGQQEGENGFAGGVKNLLHRLMVGEYAVRYMQIFEKDRAEEGRYELEYVLEGYKRERDNLSGTAARLLALREGLNLVHILSDSGKRQEARALAAVIAGGSGFAPLIPVLSFFIMCIWALGEALTDVKCLLAGGNVPLIKTAGDWRMSLEGLLEAGQARTLSGGNGQEPDGKGLDYRGYMRIMFFMGYGKDYLYRMMDVIQVNIRESQPGFLLNRCGYSVDLETRVRGKHVFFSLGLWKSRENGPTAYDTSMAVTGSY